MSAARFLMRYFPSGIGLSTAGTGMTMASGLFGLRPGPSVRRIEMWPSFNGISHNMSSKTLAWSNEVPSTLEIHRLMEVGLCGGAIESARMRPREGSSGSMATFDGNSEPSA